MQNRIPVLDLNPEISALWPELVQAFERVMKTTAFINGPDVQAFEQECANYLGVKHAVGMNSGTDALFIGLEALGVLCGDEVITTPFTFFATAEAISRVGATPVFVDIDPETFNIDVTKIEEKITSKTKAIIPVHLFGHACEMDSILSLAKKHGLKVLEDCAQCFSGEFKSRKLGSLGDAGAYSFFPSKNLGGFGDGGLFTTNDDQVAERARMIRSHGSKKKYYNEVVGYNSRLDTLQAALLRVKLPHIDKQSDGRRRVANIYSEHLKNIPGVVPPTEKAYAKHVFHQYTIRIKAGRRDQIQMALKEHGIETMIYYPVPMHKLPIYSGMKVALPNAEQAASAVLSLPIWPELQESTIKFVCDSVERALNNLTN
jgi:dTDP-4-amino-4,6-dideoxygalactose transaminase